MQNLKEEARLNRPIVQIGKNGITPSVVLEIDKHLKKRHLIKVKLLSSFVNTYNKEEEVQTLARTLHASIVSMIGNSVCLYRR